MGKTILNDVEIIENRFSSKWIIYIHINNTFSTRIKPDALFRSFRNANSLSVSIDRIALSIQRLKITIFRLMVQRMWVCRFNPFFNFKVCETNEICFASVWNCFKFSNEFHSKKHDPSNNYTSVVKLPTICILKIIRESKTGLFKKKEMIFFFGKLNQTKKKYINHFSIKI